MALGNDVMASQSGYASAIPIQKETVQDRIAQTSAALAEAHSILDSMTGNGGNEPSGARPQLGLIGGSLACQEQAATLVKRLQELRAQLGSF